MRGVLNVVFFFIMTHLIERGAATGAHRAVRFRTPIDLIIHLHETGLKTPGGRAGPDYAARLRSCIAALTAAIAAVIDS